MKRTIKLGLVYFLIAGALSSCTTITPTSSVSATKISWKERQLTLNRLQNWQLNGKIGVQTARDSGSASVDWKQNHQQFIISLSGPLGSGGLKLTGHPGIVTLDTSDGKHFSANSAEQLLSKQWGWNLPVSHLNYWVRGLPAPSSAYTSQLDSSQRLSELVQQGWHVQFMSYTRSGNIDLPDKISITSPTLKTKIVIYDWKLG